MQPQFSEKAKEYPWGWVAVIWLKPELASECKILTDFIGNHWRVLLYHRPQLVDKCD